MSKTRVLDPGSKASHSRCTADHYIYTYIKYITEKNRFLQKRELVAGYVRSPWAKAHIV